MTATCVQVFKYVLYWAFAGTVYGLSTEVMKKLRQDMFGQITFLPSGQTLQAPQVDPFDPEDPEE